MNLKKTYTDILLMVVGFAVLAFLTHIVYLYYLSATIALLSIHPRVAFYISDYWKKFGKALGWVNSRILLTIFFTLLITPLALLYRAVKNKKTEKPGNWESAPEHIDFTKPW